MQWLIEFDKSLFLYLNGLNSTYVDPVMVFFSAKLVWIPLYLLIVYLIVKSEEKKYLVFTLLAVIITFALTDTAGNLIKNTVERLRPCHDPQIAPFVHLLEGKGSMYGYVSNHAANVFGLATITAVIIRNRYYSIGIFLWAAIVAYSRIYVGKHYPLDIISGAIVGVVIALLVLRLLELVKNRKNVLRNR